MLPPKKPKGLTLDEIQAKYQAQQNQGLTQEQINVRNKNIDNSSQSLSAEELSKKNVSKYNLEDLDINVIDAADKKQKQLQQEELNKEIEKRNILNNLDGIEKKVHEKNGDEKTLEFIKENEELKALNSRNFSNKVSMFFNTLFTGAAIPNNPMVGYSFGNIFNFMSEKEENRQKELEDKQRKILEEPIKEFLQENLQKDIANNQIKVDSLGNDIGKKTFDYLQKTKPSERTLYPELNTGKESHERLKFQKANTLNSETQKLLVDYLEGKNNVWDGLATKADDLYTIGLYTLDRDARVYKAKQNYDNNVASEGDIALLNAYAKKNKVEEMQLMENRSWYKHSAGVGESLVFLEGTLATGGFGGTVRGATTKGLQQFIKQDIKQSIKQGLSKSAIKRKIIGHNILTKGTGAIVGGTAQAVISPSSYQGFLDKKNKNIQIIEDENGNEKLLVGKEYIDYYTDIYNKNKFQLNEELKRLKLNPSKNEKLIKEIEEGLLNIDEEISMLQEKSDLEAFTYGVSETLKENLAERYVGKYADELGAYLKTSKLGKKITNSNLIKGIDNNIFKPLQEGRKRFDNTATGKISNKIMYHAGAGQVLHSFPSEILEEFVVQATPTLGENYSNQLKELTNPSFYADVTAQTALMNVMFGGFGMMGNFRNYKERNNFHNLKKELQSTYDKIDKAINDDDLAETIVMSTGGTGFQIADYNYRIAKLRSEDKNEEANRLEKRKFFNLATNAIYTGTIDEFEKSIDSVINNDKLSQETRVNAQLSKENISKLKDVYKKYKESPNLYNIISLASQKITNKQSLEELDKEIVNLSLPAKEEIDRIIKLNNLDVDYSMSSLFDRKFDNQEDQNKYDNFLDLLQADNNTAINNYANLIYSKNNLQLAHYQTMKDFNDNVATDYMEKLKYENDVNSSFNDILNKVENDEIFIPGIEYNYNNKVILNEESIKLIGEELNKNINNKTLVDKIVNNKIDELKRKEFLKKIKILKQEQQVLNERFEEEKELEKTISNNYTEKVVDVEAETNFAEQLNEVLDNIASFTQEDVLFEIDDEFDSMLGEGNYSPQQLSALKENVRLGVENIESKLGRKPTFREMMEQMYKYTPNEEKVKKVFNHIVKGWQENGYTPDNYQEVYNDLFNPFEEGTSIMRDSILNMFEAELENNPKSEFSEVEDKTKEIEKQIAKANPVIVAYDEENMAITKTDINEIESRRTVNISPKLGFSALQYEEEIQGGVLTRKSKGAILNVNEDKLIDFRDLLNPDKYKTGDKLNIEVAPEDLWNQITVSNGRNTKGEAQTTTFDKWLENKEKGNPNFRNTQEFKNKVPIFYTDKNGNRLAYVQDVDWYNPFNVGNPFGSSSNPNLPTQEWIDHINKGKSLTQNLRDNIHRGLKEVTIEKSTEGVFYTIPEEQPYITLNESNPQSIIAVQRGEQLFIGNNSFSAGILLNKDSKGNQGKFDLVTEDGTKQNGHTWMINRIGFTTNDMGEQVPSYRAFPVLRKVSDEQIETTKWALAAHMILKGFTKEIKGTSYDMTLDQAKRIQRDINSNMGYNIEDPKQIINFIKSFYQTKLQGDNIASYRSLLFSDVDISEHISQHTNSNLLGANIKSIVHIDKGIVNPLNKNYEQYLKDTLFTNIKAFDVDTTGNNPVYATVIQPIINVNYQEVEEKKANLEARKEAAAQTIEEISKETKAFNIDKHINFLNEIGVDYNAFNEDDFLIENVDKLANIFNTVNGLNIAQEKTIRQYIVHNIGEKVSFDYKSKISEAKLKSEIKSELNLILRKLKTDITSLLEEVNSQEINDSRIDAIKQAYENTLKNINTIDSNFNTIFDKAFKDIQKQTQLSLKENEEKEENEDEVSLSVKNFNSDSIEESGKSKASYRLRRFLHKIPKYDNNGNVRKGYLGITEYMSFNDVYNELSKVLAMGSEVVSDYNMIINKLKLSETPFVKNVLSKLENADQQIKNEFVYNFTRHSLSSKFAMYESSKDGTILKIYDTNANEAVRVIDKKWKNENRASALYKHDLSFNSDYAQLLVDEYEQWDKDYTKVPETDLRNWLSKLGISFEDSAWKEIYKEGIFNAQKQNSFNVLYTQDKGGLFTPIVKFLKNGITNPNNFNYDAKQNIFSDLGGVMKALQLVEAKYNPNLIALSFRDSGKNISTQVPTKYITDMVQNLKRSLNEEGNNLIDDLQSLSYSENSIILDLLKSEPSFKNIFEISHLGLTAVKERGDNRSNASITELGEIDYDLAVLAGFMDRKIDKLPDTTKSNGISLRVANMMFPTMSDKTTGLYLKTAVFDFLKDSSLLFDINKKGEIEYTSDLRNLLFNQLVLPELKRIIKFHQQVRNTNIKNYDNGAMIFHLIPKLNTIKDENGINLLEKLATLENYTIEDIVEQYKTTFEDAVEDVVKNEVKHKKELWRKYNEFNKEGVEYSPMFDTKYFTEVNKNPAKDYEFAVHDFVLNSLLFNSEVFKVFAGDIANYSQDKLYKENGKKVTPFTIENPDTYISLNKEIGVNLGKRLALLIAPGNKIANSYNEMYNQIFLEDSVDISENSAYLIQNYYGEKALTEAQPILDKIKENANELDKHEQGISLLTPDKVNELKSSLANSRNELAKMYPDLDAYFDIESTDAQEYTTATEHISVLHRMGRISDEEFNTIATKLLTPGIKGQLTKEELNLVLQPIKPVHTGSYINKDFDINRVVYIKSSSFPLIPQLTAGTKLDALRNKMEELESKTGRFTRASFQTANKVGATKKTINPFDVNSLEDIKEYDSNDINSKVLVLNRNNFRIQQDVPFKSDKKQDDKVSMGTQFFKLLFGDGMIDIQDYELDGKTLTGEELYNHFNNAFKTIVDTKKQELFLDLGLSPQGNITNEANFIKKLQDLLVKEATGRGYSIKSLSGLKIEQLAAKAGYYYEFKTPLWLSSDSNRYESLLNSIVTNRIMKHKLPGNGFVAGSESGFKFKENLEGVDKSRIIFLDSWNGTELQGVHTTNEDGNIKFHKAQVFIPSKFKNDKKELVDLFENFNGNEGKYIYRRENGTLGIKEGMIDERLFNNFSFRTPTSSHVSGSTIEIAGILPPESGDLMIVPKNFTKQKGLDYDIDKESAYQLNHYMTKDGKIKVLEDTDIKAITKGLRDMIEKIDFQNLSLERKYKLFTQIQELNGGLFDEEGLEELVNPQTSIKEKLFKTELQLQRKLAENEFIKSHLAVFNNPNPEVQKRINKILSIDFAKSQAEKLEKLNDEGIKNKIVEKYINEGYSPAEAQDKYNADNLNFTMLTYSYQKNKMSLGSIGKIAIGVYANYTTFNGLLQQNKKTDVFIKDEEGNPKHLTIGKFTSDGNLGANNTIAPAGSLASEWRKKHQRTTAEVFAEKENTATDNEKEQVLGRVGVNEFTINVDAHMTLRGFDKDENGNSISYLLLSQPIIKELNNRRKDGKGILGEFKKDDVLINEIVGNLTDNQYFYANGNFFTNEESQNPIIGNMMTDASSQILTGDALLEGIEFNGKDRRVQFAALQTYLELEKEAKAVSNIQKTINVNVLGKSMIESQIKFEGLKNIHNNPIVANSQSLLGEFLDTQGDRTDGVWIGDKYVVPTTPQGQIVINGLYIGNTLYKDFFPYQDESILGVIKEILSAQGKENISDSSMIDNFETIIQEMKKYIYSRKGNNVFNLNPRVKRYELFVDDSNNTSLSTYLKDVLKDENTKFRKGIKSLNQNTLIKSFTYETGKGENELSLIKYNNAATDNLDEEDLYNSIPEMILNNHPLPNRNGQSYTTRQLAEDLVAYSFLEGGVQEATQFVKFVPVEFLESVGQYEKVKAYENGEIVEKEVFVPANRKLQSFNPKRNKDIDIFRTALGIEEDRVSMFTKQYFQHNPDKATKVFKPKKVAENIVSYISETEGQPQFISVKNKKTDAQKYSLYEHVGNGNYHKIDTLGNMGISEYEYRNENVVSLKNDSVSIAPNLMTNNDTLGLNQLNITEKSTYKDILGQISKAELKDEYKHLSTAADWLLPMVKNTGKLILDENLSGAGRANKSTLDITMNPNMTLDVSDEATAMTFVHEIIHTVSRNELDKYFNAEGTALKPNIDVPKYVSDLFVVFNEFRNKMKPELNTLMLKMSGQADPSLGNEYTEREKGLVYASKNIREFLAVALTSPVFQEEMNKVEYKKSGKTVWDKFKQTILDLLGTIYPGLKEDSFAKEAILQSMNFISEEYQSRRKAEIEKLLPNDINYHLEMDDSNMLMYGSLNTQNEVDNIQSEENIDEENQEDNMIENSLFQEDVLNLPDCL